MTKDLAGMCHVTHAIIVEEWTRPSLVKVDSRVLLMCL